VPLPGWSRDVPAYVHEERDITASGYDTTDTDPDVIVSGGAVFLEAYALGLPRRQVELTVNLDQVHMCGCLPVASWPKMKQSAGFPARIFALMPAAGDSDLPNRAGRSAEDVGLSPARIG
jgi:kynurenine formamidase